MRRPPPREVVARQPFGVFLSIDGHPNALGLARIDRMCGTPATITRWGWCSTSGPSTRTCCLASASARSSSAGVTKIASIGVFVRLADCVAGLLPLAESPTPADSFYEDQVLSVRIVTIDHERRLVLLSEAALL
ncbi:S1 domain-containing protein [Streptomyces sp. NPDC096033]|uniref:S1 domain-containing protein n=1 Tax=Streptomyces sp. NPDC096033 TaxID=3366071 RepID=UPI0037F1657A